MRARRPLTFRQRRFIEGKLCGYSSARAARRAGYSESVSQKADRIILRSPNVQAAFHELLTAAGVTDELLAQRVNEGLDAVIVRRFRYDEFVAVNYRERRLMVELVLRLKGYLT
jgi:hypothetical protein